MIIVNGQVQSNISVLDRGLQYGDGCFTTALLVHQADTNKSRLSQDESISNKMALSGYSGVMLLDEHLDRLQLTAKTLRFPEIDWQQFASEINLAVLQFSENSTNGNYSVLKIILTRGVGGRGYSSKGCESVSRIIMISPYPVHYHDWREKGITLHTSQIPLSKQPLLAGLKHLNRLEQILIRQEMDEHNWQDVIVRDTEGDMIEASAANLFWRKANILYTPDLSDSGVAGILRARIIKLIETGKTPFCLELVKTKIESLHDAEELFLTNALMPILPVNNLVLSENRVLSSENEMIKRHYAFHPSQRVALQFFYENLNLLYLNSAKP